MQINFPFLLLSLEPSGKFFKNIQVTNRDQNVSLYYWLSWWERAASGWSQSFCELDRHSHTVTRPYNISVLANTRRFPMFSKAEHLCVLGTGWLWKRGTRRAEPRLWGPVYSALSSCLQTHHWSKFLPVSSWRVCESSKNGQEASPRRRDLGGTWGLLEPCGRYWKIQFPRKYS